MGINPKTEYEWPDWQDAEQYPKTASPERWAWEFLRRNPEYQRIWGEWASCGSRKGAPKIRAKALDALKEKFGITALNPPSPDSIDQIGSILFDTHVIKHTHLWNKEPVRIDLTVDKGEVLVHYNLGWDIDSQMAVTEKLLKAIAKHKRRYHGLKIGKPRKNSLYPIYLRILDAKANNVTHAKIAEKLYPRISNIHPDYNGNKRIKDNYKAALSLRDEGFKFIAMGWVK